MRHQDWRYSICVLVVTLVYSAVGEYCFQNRDPSRRLGKCTDLLDTGTTRASCCAAGGVGWTIKANGKRCEDTCAGQEEEGEVEDGGAQSEWSSWSHCDVTCGEGVSTRQRTCTDGDVCDGDNIEEAVCYEGGCPIDGGWSDWGDWLDCTKTCNTGYKERERECNNPPPQHGGQDCTGRAKQEQPCGTDPCPVDGGWTDWSNWGRCSVTCEEGISRRRRSCTDPEPQYGGAICVGDRRETAECNEGPCPIDGGWGEYGPSSECSGTCDSRSQPVYKEERRLCNNPPPQYGGLDCDGPALRRVRCRELPKCSIHGGWSEWSAWSDCNQTCGEGIRTRERTCTNPTPQYGGEDCEGNDTGTKVCSNPRRCPVHGGWSEWEPWTPCDAPRCGLAGRQIRSRSCTDPSPKRGGSYCQGPIIERQACERLCAYWSEWSDWSPCHGGCEHGFQKRYRKCEGDGSCPSSDDFQQQRDCVCPVDDEREEVERGGSGDGSGEGSGKEDVDVDEEVWNPICRTESDCRGNDHEDETEEDVGLSYSDVLGRDIIDSSSKPGCGGNYDYSSIDYCADQNVGPEVAEGGGGGGAPSSDQGDPSDSYDSHSYDDSLSVDDSVSDDEAAVAEPAVPAAVPIDAASSDSYSFDAEPVVVVPANPDVLPGGADAAGSSSDNAGGIAEGEPVVADDGDSYSYE